MAQAVSQPRPAAVAAVLNKAHTWVSARRKVDGTAFFYIQGTAGAVYMTSTIGCTCPAAQHYSGPCKHQLAVQQREARQTAQTVAAPQPAPKSYAALMDRHLDD